MPPAIGGTLTIIFDAGVSSVTMFGTTITTSGGSISNFTTGYPETCVGTFVLNSGYAIDTITFNADDSTTGTLSGYTNSDFSIDAGVSSISGTLTITTKEASDPYNIVIKNKEGIKLLTKDKDIHFDDDVKITIDESLLGGGGSVDTQGTVKALFDAKKTCYREFGDSKITSEELEKVLSYSDTSQVTDMGYMFINCTELTAVPQLDTSQVTNMQYMFDGCRKLTTVPQLDASNVTSTYAMFRTCVKLTEAPLLLNSNKVTNANQMFYNCSELVTVPALDMSSVVYTSNMFYQCSKLKHILFTGIKASFDISASTQFEREDLLVILNNLAPAIATLTMGSTNLAKLTATDKAIATNKSWTLK